MKFISLHGLNADNQQYRFFLNADKIVSVCPAHNGEAERGYRSVVITADKEIAVTESLTTVMKHLNGEKYNG